MNEESSYKILKFKGSELPEQYRAMIYSKFLRSLRYGNEMFKLIDQEPYFKNYHSYIAALLRRPESIVKIAVLSDDSDVALGWALLEPNKLHYIYVNKDNRHIGIGKTLASEPFEVFSHITTIGLSIWPKMFPKAKFDPFA